jgi:hypothetical protein
MLNSGKIARLILFATVPVFAMAQSPQVRPIPQSASVQPLQAMTPGVVAPQSSASLPVANTTSSPNGSEQDATATVEYVKGQLTVISHGAPLGAVLKLVSAKTGALVALTPELQNEPVVGQLGPGTVREVMTSLLDSPRIGYILMGAGNDPDRLQKIVVQSRMSAGHGAMADLRPPQPPQDDEETKLDENGHLPNGLTPEESKMSQDEIRANWQRIRDQKLQAEILQQKQDRERERLEADSPQPPPQQQPQVPQNQDAAPQQ